MRGKDISDALGGVEGRFVEESAETKKTTLRWLKWTAPVAAAAVIALVLGLFFGGGRAPVPQKPLTPQSPERFRITGVVYPAMAPYSDGSNREERDAWYQSRRERAAYYSYCEGLEPFLTKTIPEFLGEEEGKNALYSPLNVYMALAMLAEISDGNTRRQVLELLGESSIESLRTKANGVWNACYCNDGATTSIPASSVWMDQGLAVNSDTLKRLSETYYASSFKGDMGSDEFSAAFQGWLNEQTDDLLADQIGGIRFDPNTIFALAATLNYQARWYSSFRPENNTSGRFHGSSGEETCEYMHGGGDQYCWGETFSACRKTFGQYSGMWFILPDQGINVEDLLKDEESLRFISNPEKWQNVAYPIVDLTLPKFDVSSQTDLIDGLKRLGVTDCFDFDKADFSPLLTEDTAAAVSEVKHGVRVVVDEEGVKAAAYTVMIASGGMPTDRVEFTVDRPFIFVITGQSGLPLFVGIVNHM